MKSLLEAVDGKNVILGMVGSTVFDGLVSIPLDAAGLLYAWDIKDAEGNWIWGIWTGDIITILIGAGMVGVGELQKNKALTDLGFGWLLGISAEKISELSRSGYMAWKRGQTPAAGLPAGGKTAPKFIPSVLMPKFQQGNGNPFRPGLRATVGARPAITVGPYAGGITAPKFIPGVLRPKYMHGS